MSLPLGFAPFAGESRRDCLIVAAGGVAAFLVGYAGAAAVFFGLGALDHGVDRDARRIAGTFGSLACWGFYAAMFTRGKGGPILNAVVYPVGTAVLVPVGFRWLLFGPDWGGLRERLGFFLFRPALFVDAAFLLGPGLVFFASVLTLWASRLGEAEVERWQRTHLREEFYREFVEQDGG